MKTSKMANAAYSLFGRILVNRRAWLASATLLLAAFAGSPRIAHGQITPLEDVVPISEFDIRMDDLIRLATASADAVRELRTAELSVKTLQALRPAANVTNLEMQIANINVKASEQKVRILRAIAESLLRTAQAKCDFLKRMETTDQPAAPSDPADATNQANPRLVQAEATVRILQMILEIE
ncbi:MAG: hypothetical protein JW809_19140 [Pirellulales bacterium]|nr:hypothetical protein [Pirellulales bacterium]